MVSEVKEIIKLASWKDVNVVALKLSAQRSHRQLHKIVRKYRAVLQRSAIEAAGQLSASHLTKEQLLAVSTDTSAIMSSGDEDQLLPTDIAYLKNLPRTVSKLQHIRDQVIQPSISSAEQNCRDVVDLAAAISDQAKSLKDTPLTGSEEVQQKQASALLTRKRRRWADLLRELKRLGLSHNPTETNRRSIQELLTYHRHGVLPAASSPATTSFDTLYSQATELVPRLAACLVNHHEDLTGREIARAVGSAHSLAIVCINGKRDLLNLASMHIRFASCLRKLEAAFSSDPLPDMAQEGHKALRGPVVCLNAHLSLVCKSQASLSKLKATVLLQSKMLGDASSVEAIAEELESLILLAADCSVGLRNAVDKNTNCAPGFFLQSDRKLLRHAEIIVDSILERLSSVQQNYPAWRYQVVPVAQFLATARNFTVQSAPTKLSPAASTVIESFKSLVDCILITFQRLSALSATTVEENASDPAEDLPTRSIKAESSIVAKHLLALNLEGVSSAMSQFMSAIHHATFASQSAIDEARLSIRRALPFLAHYEVTLHQCLGLCMNQNLSNLNLLQTVGQLILTISDQGFCQPSKGDEQSESADAKGESTGTGMGEGAGGKNVSKEIEGEEQVEGLQNEAQAEEEDGGEQPDDDDRVEMENDFDGKLEDAKEEESGAEGQEDEDEASQPDADEAVDKVDPNDPNAVDEKFWGEEDDKQQPEAEERGKDATEGQDQSTELGEKQAGEKKQPENANVETPDDLPEKADQPDDGMDVDQPAEDEQLQDYVGPQETDKLDLPDASKDDEQVLPEDAEMNEVDDQPDGEPIFPFPIDQV